MGCNCGKKRLMAGNTSANLTADAGGSIAPDRPDIAAAKAEATARVEAARAELQDN